MAFELIVHETVERMFRIEAATAEEARQVFERTVLADLQEVDVDEDEIVERKVVAVREARQE